MNFLVLVCSVVADYGLVSVACLAAGAEAGDVAALYGEAEVCVVGGSLTYEACDAG